MPRVEASTKTPGTEEREAIGMGLPSQDSSQGGFVCRENWLIGSRESHWEVRRREEQRELTSEMGNGSLGWERILRKDSGGVVKLLKG